MCDWITKRRYEGSTLTLRPQCFTIYRLEEVSSKSPFSLYLKGLFARRLGNVHHVLLKMRQYSDFNFQHQKPLRINGIGDSRNRKRESTSHVNLDHKVD
jgi:hypothetical protein